MREAFCAVWNGYCWCPKTNNPPESYDLTDCDSPKNPKYNLLTPRFNIGDKIKFKWGDGYLRGKIKQIRAHYNILPNEVCYTVEEIAHLREVYDTNNKADIELIKELN